jgi:ABC-type bacteriocin/lantibiotic exporter with double-glycine peptidase domain
VFEWASDVQKTWQAILGSCGIALGVGFVYMILMRYFSGLLTWLAILLYFTCMGLLGLVFFFKYMNE